MAQQTGSSQQEKKEGSGLKAREAVEMWSFQQ